MLQSFLFLFCYFNNNNNKKKAYKCESVKFGHNRTSLTLDLSFKSLNSQAIY